VEFSAGNAEIRTTGRWLCPKRALKVAKFGQSPSAQRLRMTLLEIEKSLIEPLAAFFDVLNCSRYEGCDGSVLTRLSVPQTSESILLSN